MLDFFVNAVLVLCLLVSVAAALVALAYARPPRRRRGAPKRRHMPLRLERTGSATAPTARRRGAA